MVWGCIGSEKLLIYKEILFLPVSCAPCCSKVDPPVGGSGSNFFSVKDTAIATENLRRILQLDIADH